MKGSEGDYRPLAAVPSKGSDSSKPYSGSSKMAACIANLSNTIMGAGMLGLPAAFAGAGNVMGCFLIVLAACFSANGLYLLTLCAERVGITKEVSLEGSLFLCGTPVSSYSY